MTIENMHKWFDLILDKVGSPYFSSPEKDSFLQRAEVHYVNSFFKNPSTVHLMEDTSIDVDYVKSLITEVKLDTDDEGRLYYSNIDSVLQSETSISGAKMMYILNASKSITSSSELCAPSYQYIKSRFIRHNDFFAHQANAFKKATTEYPTHRCFDNYLRFNPDNKSNVYLTVIRYPKLVTLDDPNSTGARGVNAVDSELPDKSQNEIVFMALKFAGVAIREADFYQIVSNEKQLS